jgi:hypothetical protein
MGPWFEWLFKYIGGTTVRHIKYVPTRIEHMQYPKIGQVVFSSSGTVTRTKTKARHAQIVTTLS